MPNKEEIYQPASIDELHHLMKTDPAWGPTGDKLDKLKHSRQQKLRIASKGVQKQVGKLFDNAGDYLPGLTDQGVQMRFVIQCIPEELKRSLLRGARPALPGARPALTTLPANSPIRSQQPGTKEHTKQFEALEKQVADQAQQIKKLRAVVKQSNELRRLSNDNADAQNMCISRALRDVHDD